MNCFLKLTGNTSYPAKNERRSTTCPDDHKSGKFAEDGANPEEGIVGLANSFPHAVSPLRHGGTDHGVGRYNHSSRMDPEARTQQVRGRANVISAAEKMQWGQP
jgi:hypothetical protein